jgi:hypothetical protein
MKKESGTPEYRKFADALRTVLSVRHSKMRAQLDADRREGRKKRAKASASRVPAGA